MMNLIARIPDVVWAALGGSLLTLFGVWLQNRGESKRQKERLALEALERRRERDLELRRDLYVQAADSAFRAQRALLRLGDSAQPLAELGSSLDPVDLGGLSKAHLVGRLDTIKALDQVSMALVDAILALLDARIGVEVAKAECEQRSREVNNLEMYRTHLMAVTREASAGIGFGPPQVESYIKQVEDIEAELRRARQPLEKANATLAGAERQLMLKSVGVALDYGAALARANVAVRAELEQIDGFDIKGYEQHIKESASRMTTVWQSFVSKWAD